MHEHIHVVCTHTNKHKFMHSRINKHQYTHTQTSIHIHTHTHTHKQTSIYTHTHTNKHQYTHVHTHTHKYTSMRVHTQNQTNPRTHTHTHVPYRQVVPPWEDQEEARKLSRRAHWDVCLQCQIWQQLIRSDTNHPQFFHFFLVPNCYPSCAFDILFNTGIIITVILVLCCIVCQANHLPMSCSVGGQRSSSSLSMAKSSCKDHEITLCECIVVTLALSLTLYQPMTHICVMSSHKPIRIYMGGLTLGVNTLHRLLCFFKLFPMVGKGLTKPRSQARGQ